MKSVQPLVLGLVFAAAATPARAQPAVALLPGPCTPSPSAAEVASHLTLEAGVRVVESKAPETDALVSWSDAPCFPGLLRVAVRRPGGEPLAPAAALEVGGLEPRFQARLVGLWVAEVLRRAPPAVTPASAPPPEAKAPAAVRATGPVDAGSPKALHPRVGGWVRFFPSSDGTLYGGQAAMLWRVPRLRWLGIQLDVDVGGGQALTETVGQIGGGLGVFALLPLTSTLSLEAGARGELTYLYLPTSTTLTARRPPLLGVASAVVRGSLRTGKVFSFLQLEAGLSVLPGVVQWVTPPIPDSSDDDYLLLSGATVGLGAGLMFD